MIIWKQSLQPTIKIQRDSDYEVIEYLLPCFSYALKQNKGDIQGMEKNSRLLFHMHLDTMMVAVFLGVTS